MIRNAELRRGFSSQDDEQLYLEALNLCFGGWGGREMFEWVFMRRCADRLPDVLTLWVDGRPVAGSAISYRRVSVRGGKDLIAGIMTASWTLPQARGGGAFQRMIAESIEQTAARGGALLLAFVTSTNTSRRRLESEGADLTPTYYCRADTVEPVADQGIVEVTGQAGVAAAIQPDRPEARFTYSGDEWIGQFVKRPGEISMLEGSGRWQAVVERAAGFDRVHAIAADERGWPDAMASLASRAAASGRRAFAFTTRAVEAEALRERGFAIIDGFLTALVADRDALASALDSHRPDGVPHGMLSDPGSPWFLGPWALQNGDRI